MFTNLVLGVLSSIIASIIIGSTYKIIKTKKNSGNIQKNGENQIIISKSNNNSVKFGGDSSEEK